jgi:hypothetical protein
MISLLLSEYLKVPNPSLTEQTLQKTPKAAITCSHPFLTPRHLFLPLSIPALIRPPSRYFQTRPAYFVPWPQLFALVADMVIPGIKAKVENKHQYEEYLEDLKGLREELGINLKEDLYPEGHDSPYYNP